MEKYLQIVPKYRTWLLTIAEILGYKLQFFMTKLHLSGHWFCFTADNFVVLVRFDIFEIFSIYRARYFSQELVEDNNRAEWEWIFI